MFSDTLLLALADVNCKDHLILDKDDLLNDENGEEAILSTENDDTNPYDLSLSGQLRQHFALVLVTFMIQLFVTFWTQMKLSVLNGSLKTVTFLQNKLYEETFI